MASKLPLGLDATVNRELLLQRELEEILERELSKEGPFPRIIPVYLDRRRYIVVEVDGNENFIEKIDIALYVNPPEDLRTVFDNYNGRTVKKEDLQKIKTYDIKALRKNYNFELKTNEKLCQIADKLRSELCSTFSIPPVISVKIIHFDKNKIEVGGYTPLSDENALELVYKENNSKLSLDHVSKIAEIAHEGARKLVEIERNPEAQVEDEDMIKKKYRQLMEKISYVKYEPEHMPWWQL